MTPNASLLAAVVALTGSLVLSACRHARDPLDDIGSEPVRHTDSPRGETAPDDGDADDDSHPAGPVAPFDPDDFDEVSRRHARPPAADAPAQRPSGTPRWLGRELWAVQGKKHGFRLAVGSAKVRGRLDIARSAARAAASAVLGRSASEAPSDEASAGIRHDAVLPDVMTIDLHVDDLGRVHVLVAMPVTLQEAAATPRLSAADRSANPEAASGPAPAEVDIDLPPSPVFVALMRPVAQRLPLPALDETDASSIAQRLGELEKLAQRARGSGRPMPWLFVSLKGPSPRSWQGRDDIWTVLGEGQGYRLTTGRAPLEETISAAVDAALASAGSRLGKGARQAATASVVDVRIFARERAVEVVAAVPISQR